MKELSIEDRCQFRNFLRMTPSNLEDIFRMIGDRVSKKDTHMRQALSPKEKLALTLRFLDFFLLKHRLCLRCFRHFAGKMEMCCLIIVYSYVMENLR